jgi:hypothetical protein
LALGGLLGFLGCSSSNTSSGSAPDEAGVPSNDDSGSSGGDGGNEAAGRPTEDILVDDTRPANPPLSCTAFCQSENYTCVTSCALDDAGTGAGIAIYGDSFSGSQTKTIASCTDAPLGSIAGGPSGTESLNSYDCCCRSPKHEKIDGPLPAKSCDDVCAAHGLKCDDFTIWSEPDTTDYQGGAHGIYDDGGATTFANAPCATPPAATHKQASLVSYECGCF